MRETFTFIGATLIEWQNNQRKQSESLTVKETLEARMHVFMHTCCTFILTPKLHVNRTYERNTMMQHLQSKNCNMLLSGYLHTPKSIHHTLTKLNEINNMVEFIFIHNSTNSQ